jgi:hypothetical protein
VTVEFAKFTAHNDRRSKTAFSYIRPPFTHKELMSDVGKIRNNFGKRK